MYPICTSPDSDQVMLDRSRHAYASCVKKKYFVAAPGTTSGSQNKYPNHALHNAERNPRGRTIDFLWICLRQTRAALFYFVSAELFLSRFHQNSNQPTAAVISSNLTSKNFKFDSVLRNACNNSPNESPTTSAPQRLRIPLDHSLQPCMLSVPCHT